MAALDLARVFRVPGNLVLGPTTLGATPSYPYGGTALGYVDEVELDWGLRYVPVVAEEWGETTEELRVGEFPVIALTLKQWDAAVISSVFPSVTTTGSPSGIKDGMQRINGGARPGIVTAMSPLLFAPADPNHPGVIFYRPIPRLAESAKLALSLRDDAVFPLVFVATRDSNDKVYQLDRLEHLAPT